MNIEDFYKNLPFFEQVEQTVLGSLMIAPHAWDDIAEIITEREFYVQRHKIIFRVIVEQISNNKPIDIITLTDAFNKKGLLKEAGGESYLYQIAYHTPTAANVKHYAAALKTASVDRDILAIANEVIESVANKEENRLDLAQQKFARLADNDVSEAVFIQDILPEVLEKIEERRLNKGVLAGLPTGFVDLDRITHGLQCGDLIIIGARPSQGKTLLSMNIAENVTLKSNKCALVFSMEMSRQSLTERALSSLSNVEMDKIRSGNLSESECQKIADSTAKFYQSKLIIDDRSALSVVQIRAKARSIKRQHGLDLIVVDYLTLMHGEGENETHKIGAISRGLKTIARDLNVPIIVVSQLNRSVENNADKRPTMAHLRQSGAIEQDADLIMFIYRDEEYNKESPHKGMAEIIIAKHRNGATGKVMLSFKREFCKFENYTGREYVEVPLKARPPMTYAYKDN